jgi:hypothetical protein
MVTQVLNDLSLRIGKRTSTRFCFAPANYCIYCGTLSGPLDIEHVIPEALGGVIEYPSSSCRPCARIINTYEFKVARGMMYDFRVKHNLPSKRSKSRRPARKSVDIHGTGQLMSIPYDIYPSPMFYYKFGRATALSGLRFGTGIFEWTAYGIAPQDDLVTFRKSFPNAIYSFQTMPYEFARLLAKIGHSFAVGTFGPGSFSILKENLELILCRSNDVQYTVGSNLSTTPGIPDAGHVLFPALTRSDDGRIYLVILIKLFASLETPVFHVLVGEKPSQLIVDMVGDPNNLP